MNDCILYMFNFMRITDILSFRYISKKMYQNSIIFSEKTGKNYMDKQVLEFKGYIKTPEYIIDTKISANCADCIEHIKNNRDTIRIIHFYVNSKINLTEPLVLDKLRVLKLDKYCSVMSENRHKDNAKYIICNNIEILDYDDHYYINNLDLFIDDDTLDLDKFNRSNYCMSMVLSFNDTNIFKVYKNVTKLKSKYLCRNIINIINLIFPNAKHYSFNISILDVIVYSKKTSSEKINNIEYVYVGVSNGECCIGNIRTCRPMILDLFPNLKNIISKDEKPKCSKVILQQ